MSTGHIDATRRTFVSYIDRTREYYLAQGYGNPYQWAHFEEVPFERLARPLSECRLTLITTASPLGDERARRNEPPKGIWWGRNDAPPAGLYTGDLAWDKESTHTDDLDSFFPIHRLQELARDRRIGGLAARHHGVPTEYSQRRTRERDAPEILRRCRKDGVDAALLVPL